MATVYILLVNWNNWQDTIVCLESLFRIDYSAFNVILCDNNSTDNSMTYIEAWANGDLEAFSSPEFQLRSHIFPPVQKPIKLKRYSRREAEQGGDSGDTDSRFIMIQNDDNLGFAGGNNVGLKYALARDDFDYIWLLNNDTVVKPDTLTHLIKRIQEGADIGMCGSTLLYYDRPNEIQACGGGTYNKWIGFSRHIGSFSRINESINARHVEDKMDYVVGASIVISRKFLQTTGLMCEDYFHYYEDIDWSTRAKKNFRLGYAPESIVYHKEGGSSGGSNRNNKSMLSDYYFVKNRLLYARKFTPYTLPAIYLGLLVTLFRRIMRRQYGRVWMVLKLAFTLGNYNRP